MGQVLLRCEAPEHPTDVAGGCLCGSTILSPCDERPLHVVDRRQCFFTCSVEAGNTTRLHCPSGAVPTREPGGCGCGPGRVLTPCPNGATPKAVTIEGKECKVTCG